MLRTLKKPIQSLVEAHRTARVGPVIRIVIFLAIVLPVFFLSLFSYLQTSRDLTESALSRRQSVARLAAMVLKERLDNLVQIGISLAGRVQFRELIEAGQWTEAVKILESIPQDFPFIERVFLTDPAGTETADMPSLPGAVGKNFAYRDWYKGVAREWKPYISEVYQRAAEPQYKVVAASIPIRSKNQTILGILVLQVRTDTLLDWVREIDAGASGFAYVADAKGHLAAHPKFPPQGDIVDFSKVPVVEKLLAGNDGVGIFYNSIEKQNRLSAYEPVPEYGWGVVVQQPASAAFALRDENLRRSLFIYGFIVLLICGIALLVLAVLQRLDNARQREKTFLESIGDGVFAVDRAFRITLWNRTAYELTGWQAGEVIGKPFRNFIKFIREEDRSECVSFIEDAATAGTVKNLENGVLLIAKDGREVPIGDSAAPVFDNRGKVTGVIVVFRDISFQKQAREALRRSRDELEDRVRERTGQLEKTQQQFLHSQKMEAIGRLAGGIAHDFNNLLTVMTGYAELMGNSLEQTHPLQNEVEEIQKAGDRAVVLVRQLLAFSRQRPNKPVRVNVNRVIENLTGMFRRLIGENIKLQTKMAPDLAMVRLDPSQLEQVLANLIVNARDAMEGGGNLTIETANVILDEAYARSHEGIVPGNYIVIAVSDTGCGIDKELQSRIFEPFFTTKGQGKGTGLGLATCFGIVKQNAGDILVYSEVGRGTTFKIYFPQAEGGGKAEEPETKTVPAKITSAAGETVLLVEDEEGVRHFSERILCDAGYRVLTAKSGSEALSLWDKEKDSEIKLLLTDMVMPGMGGMDLAKALKQRCPQLKILFTSGYTEMMSTQSELLAAGSDFIEKPFSPHALILKVHEVLQA